MVGIIDYGTANVGALLNMHRRCGLAARLVQSPKEITAVDRLILPGIGAFDNGMRHLRARGFDTAVRDAVARRVPLLGICLGMQLLGHGSDEGTVEGLGLLDARCERFHFPGGSPCKVPHQGWCRPELQRASCLLPELSPRTRYYFSHSYHMLCNDARDVVATAKYGIMFTAVVERGCVFGAQFHPEKSHVHGMRLLRAFSAGTP